MSYKVNMVKLISLIFSGPVFTTISTVISKLRFIICRAIKLLGRNPVKCDIRHSLKRRSNKITIQDLSTSVCVVSEYLRCTVYSELKQRLINTKYDINKNICITITYIHYILQYFLFNHFVDTSRYRVKVNL